MKTGPGTKNPAAAFCQTHALHGKTMREIQKLRVQLSRIMDINGYIPLGVAPSSAPPRGSTSPAVCNKRVRRRRALHIGRPPSIEQEIVLRQIIAAGFIDNVARRQRRQRAPGGASSTPTLGGARQNQRKGVPYELANPRIETVAMPAYIHPDSCLNRSDSRQSPEFVVYREVITTQTTRRDVPQPATMYMVGVTTIDPTWLWKLAANTPLCCMSRPALLPHPRYDAREDKVMCFRTPLFGQHRWALPKQLVPFPWHPQREPGAACGDTSIKCEFQYTCWFARLLLEGKVVAALAHLVPLYAVSPAGLTSGSSDNSGRPANIDLVTALLSCSRAETRCNDKSPPVSLAALRERWKVDSTFLQGEVVSWVQHAHRARVIALWPDVIGL